MFFHSKPMEKLIKKLDLDLKNPRLIGYRKKENISSQKDILIALASRYDVIEICKSILQNGFHPDEIPIVIPSEDGKKRLTVVEGNRRVAACKILENPDLLKDTKLKSQVQRLRKHPNYAAALEITKKLNVVILPNRKEAAAYLAAKHTQESIKSWSPYTQGAYYISLKESTETTLADLKDALNDQVDLNRIKDRVLFYRLSNYMLDLECWTEDERNELYDQIDILKIEAIKRLIKSSDFRHNVGKINIDEYGDLVTNGLTQDATAKVFEILSRDTHFNKNDSNSNLLNTRQEDKPAIKKYILEISNTIKTSDRVDTETKINSDPIDVKPPETPSLKPSTKQPRPRQTNRLLHSDIPTPQHIKLSAMCNEAKRANTKSNLYSSALLARALIEITLKVWIKESGRETALQEKYREKAFNFESILSFFEQDIKTLITGSDAQKAVKGVVSDLQKTNREILNLTSHNDLHLLSETQVTHIQSGLNTIANCIFKLIGTKSNNQ